MPDPSPTAEGGIATVAVLSVASALPAAEGNAVPEWIMVFPAGVSRGVDGRGPYRLSDPATVAARSLTDGKPIVLDYNHQSVFACKNGGPSPAAAWIDKLEAREGALWGHVETWTEAGRTAVASKEYRFISPAFTHDPKTGDVLKLASVGLVNAPNLAELPAIQSQLFDLPGESMNQKELDALAATLGLAAGSTLEQISAHCRDLTAKASQQPPVVTGAPGAPNSGNGGFTAGAPGAPNPGNGGFAAGVPDPKQFVPMSAFTELQQTVGALMQSDAKTKAATAVEEACRAGKVTPAMKDWAFAYASTDLAGFQAFAAASPVIVAGGALLPGTAPAGAAHAGQQDDKAVLAVCANLGITVEQYRKVQGVTTAQQDGAKA